MNELGISRVYEADFDILEKDIRRGDEVIEFSDGTIRPRRPWRNVVQEIMQLPEEQRVQAIRRAAELEASVVDYLARGPR
jgi:hypothetical protein